MRQAREIIRLKLLAGILAREVAGRLRLAPSSVRETLKRLESAGLPSQSLARGGAVA